MPLLTTHAHTGPAPAILLDGQPLKMSDPALLAALIPTAGLEVRHLAEPGSATSAQQLTALTTALGELRAGIMHRALLVALEGGELTDLYNHALHQHLVTGLTTRDVLLLGAVRDDLHAGTLRLACLDTARKGAEAQLALAKRASLTGGGPPADWATCLHAAALNLDMMAEAAGLAAAMHDCAAHRLEQLSPPVLAALVATQCDPVDE